ncbi:cation diffusion facilitator family transporter [Candidatus Bathyarchaeota archaeon]|nr:cation diffusion facilitator family transporter [Candidatus Bathyarchaeota archaeon]
MKVLKLSTIAITSVFLVEAFLGLVVGSLAILSDGMHALFDTLAAFGLFIATRASLKPPDEEHMYGHEKLESLGGLVGGLTLIGLALILMHESILRIIGNRPYINLELKFAGFVAIGYTLCIDFFRVGTFKKALESKSFTLKAGLYHAVADLGSTIIALLGFGLAAYGFYSGDAIASTVLSLLLIYLSVGLIRSSGMELSDAISKDVAEKVRKEIVSTKGIQKYENLRVRRAGSKTFVEVTLHVPDYVNLEEAHDLASKIEEKIRKSVGNADITIHTEPLKKEMRTEEIVEKIAEEIEGVKEIHNIATVYTDGRLYITLHARVDPKLSVQEAHEIAGKIENKINARISEVGNVTVHVEPFTAKAQKVSKVDENEIKKIVQETLENFPQALRCKKIVTYAADKKHYINIDCSFTSQITVEEAHKIASLIESNIRKQFAKTVVTVHTEPS